MPVIFQFRQQPQPLPDLEKIILQWFCQRPNARFLRPCRLLQPGWDTNDFYDELASIDYERHGLAVLPNRKITLSDGSTIPVIFPYSVIMIKGADDGSN